jgi:hypothetical protein
MLLSNRAGQGLWDAIPDSDPRDPATASRMLEVVRFAVGHTSMPHIRRARDALRLRLGAVGFVSRVHLSSFRPLSNTFLTVC